MYTEDELVALVRRLHTGDRQASIDLYEYTKTKPVNGPYLVLSLRDALSNLETRDHAALALAEIAGPSVAKAIPELVKALRYDPENYIAVPFVMALGAIGEMAKSAVPAIVDALEVGDPVVDFHVAEALGKIGPAAETAIPALRKLVDESKDDDVREAANLAIKQIAGS